MKAIGSRGLRSSLKVSILPHEFIPIYRKFYLFNFLIIFYKLELNIDKIMKNKKDLLQKKRDILDKFLSILWAKEFGDLKYTLNI